MPPTEGLRTSQESSFRAAAVGTALTKRDFVNSLSRGLDVLRSFQPAKPSMTLSDGYAASDGKYFRLLPKVLDLGTSVMASLDISETMQPVMNELAERVQESCFAAILDGESVIYVARAVSSRVVNVGITVGSRSPAHAVSTGRVLLSGVDDKSLKRYFDRAKLRKLTPYTVTSKPKLRAAIDLVRRQGWSIVNQELEVGLQSISVPIRDGDGTIIAALNVCCPSPRVTRRDMESRILSAMFESARQVRLTRRIG
jgi:IclR family transcriptional regulator, pca regulon regulatory protein